MRGRGKWLPQVSCDLRFANVQLASMLLSAEVPRFKQNAIAAAVARRCDSGASIGYCLICHRAGVTLPYVFPVEKKDKNEKR